MTLSHDIAQMTAMVSQLGGMVEARCRTVVDAYQERDIERAEAIVRGDLELNMMQRQVDQYALQLLALQKPFAMELRAIVASVRIASLLEQIGDLLVSIARRINHISHHPRLSQAIAIPNLAVSVQGHLAQALDAFSQLNAITAISLLEADDEVDEQYHAVNRQILSKMAESQDAALIAGYADLLQIAKNWETIGDTVIHITEQTVFLIKGHYIDDGASGNTAPLATYPSTVG
jgi:phosphate transport system protein